MLLLQVLGEGAVQAALLKVDTRNLSTVAKILAAFSAAARLSPKKQRGSDSCEANCSALLSLHGEDFCGGGNVPLGSLFFCPIDL